MRHQRLILILAVCAFALAQAFGLHFHVAGDHHHHEGASHPEVAAHLAMDVHADHLTDHVEGDEHDVKTSVAATAAKTGFVLLLGIVASWFTLVFLASPLRDWRSVSPPLRPPRARGAFALQPPSQAPPALA